MVRLPDARQCRWLLVPLADVGENFVECCSVASGTAHNLFQTEVQNRFVRHGIEVPSYYCASVRMLSHGSIDVVNDVARCHVADSIRWVVDDGVDDVRHGAWHAWLTVEKPQ